MKNLACMLPALAVLLIGCQQNPSVPNAPPATPPSGNPPAKMLVAQNMPSATPTPQVAPSPAPGPASGPQAAPTPQSDQDNKIMMDIRDMLQKDTSISESSKGVMITTKDGVVTLNGQVSSEADKSSIEMLIGSVNGVRRVDSYLTVSNS